MKKLGDITDIKDSSRISNTLWISNGVPYLRSSDLSNDNIKGELFLSKKTYQEYSAKTGAPTRGDLLFTSGGKIGVTYYKEDDDELYVQGGSILYAKTSESEHLDGRFLKSYFDTPILKKYIENASTGLTIKHFTLKPAKDTPIAIPGLDEQKKIGLFFKDIDDTIALHQQELDALKQTKQGFLQKMFPKEGKNTPEIRFKGFKEEWREVLLGKITESYSGGTPSAGNKMYYNGIIPFIRSAEINSFTTELFLTEEGLKNSSAKLVDKGTILYAMYGATSGEVGISKIKGAINQAILAIQTKEGYDSQYVYQYLKKSKKSIVNSYLQGGQGNLSGAIIKKISIWVPSNKIESKKIGEFFKQLDEVIDLKEKELEALKKTKQGFLQKMFV